MRTFPAGGGEFLELDTEFLADLAQKLKSVSRELDGDWRSVNAQDVIEVDPLASKVADSSRDWDRRRREINDAVAVLHVCVVAVRDHFMKIDEQLARKAKGGRR